MSPRHGRARHARHGEWMILGVALVIGAAIAAMIGFSLLAAERLDQASRARWSELVLENLEHRADDLRRDLASFAHWNEAVLRTTQALDLNWLHENFGRWMHEALGHDRSYVLVQGRLAYAAIDGSPVPASEARFDAAAILPLAELVQAALLEQEPQQEQGVGANGPREQQFLELPRLSRAGYLRVEGRAALVAAMNITPDHDGTGSPSRIPPIVVTVAFLDQKFLDRLVSELNLVAPAIADEPPQDGRHAVAIPTLEGQLPWVWLSWVPDDPGAALLRALLPALTGTAILLLAVATVILWYARRATLELAKSEALASRLAYVDPLCGLANRTMLMRSLRERLARVAPEQRLAVFFLDLDGFKDINDTLGHHVGDLLLAEIGARLGSLDLPSLVASRFGGDEFVLLASVGPDNHEVEAIGAVVLDAIRRPATLAGHVLSVSGTVGATVAPDHGTEARELIRLADIAVYRAKVDARGSLRLFNPQMEREVLRRRDLEIELKRAIVEGELAVYYQPQFAVDGETVVGFEALVRWLHPVEGLISPGEFIPVAEQCGLITDLDMWVLRRVCEQTRGWGDTKIAVNLSPVDFHSRNMAETVRRILRDTGFPPERLEVEITENLLFGNEPEAFAALAALRSLGIRVALDDFGSGYSSLGYIRRFRVDTIKIDRSFIQNIGHTEDAAAIIDCVVRLARALAITVTAEGVETREQLRYLQSVGCHYVQGFLLAAPMPLASVDRFLERVPRGKADLHAERPLR